jgi:coenzyme F420-reducing hydrogenase beta subunit
VCPKHAIQLCEDKCGFVYPVIENKCVECHLCTSVCPSLNEVELKMPKQCFAARAKNIPVGCNVTSGGLATTLYYWFLTEKKYGIVYGTVFSAESCCFSFYRCSDIEKIKELSGSKYIQIVPSGIYSNVKNDLLEGRDVLFVGTPCQIQGLKSYLKKNFANLFLIDIVCHGVPSQKMLFESINKMIGIQKFSFRKNNRYILRYRCDNEPEQIILSRDSLFFEGFSNGNNLRQSCHNCKYAGIERVSDITLGDFWGLGEDSVLRNELDQGRGVSLVLINTEKGNTIFKEIKYLLKCEQRSITEAQQGNSQLRHPVFENRYSKKFRDLYRNNSYEFAIRKSRNLKSRIKNIPGINKLVRIIRS